MPNPITVTLATCVALAACAIPAAAQEDDALRIELNGLTATENGCRVTFVVDNGIGADVSKAIFEVAIFGKSGLVENLIVLDFRDLPNGRTRVRQFDLADLECEKVSRILINDATECTGLGIDPSDCIDRLRTSTASEVEFGS